MKKIFLILSCLYFILPTFVIADSARSTIIMDMDSKRILYEKNSHEKRLIASITKIMTFIIAYENSNLEDEIKVGEEILSMYGTNIYVEVGEKISVKDLLYGLLLRSGNDAAMTLATNILGEEEFVKKMNEKAQKLGMKDTVFENPHGLDENTQNYSTAYDMMLLSQYAYQNKLYKEIISTKKYTTQSSLKTYIWYNRMNLLNTYKYCIGGKNGYTPNAGKTLVSYANKDNVTLSITTLDDPNIYQNHENLYETFFEEYKKYTIIDKEKFDINPNISEDNLYIKNSFQYLLREEEIKNISTLIEIYPTPKNNIAGRIVIKLNKKIIGEVEIYKKESKKKKDRVTIFQNFKKIIDWIIEKN